MKNIYIRRPFKSRNAEEYDFFQTLNLFVSPLDGVISPFEFENNIIKGRRGSGKTMYLTANYAYYFHNIVPNIIFNRELILPIMIKLSDFQHIREPHDIYKDIILKVIEELSLVYIKLHDAKNLSRIHMGLKSISGKPILKDKISDIARDLAKLRADVFTETVMSAIGLKGGIQPNFIRLSKEFSEQKSIELKQKPNPNIKHIEDAYKFLLEDFGGKILLLIDEAGSVDKRFFIGDDNNASFFEILMNQFRTMQFIRTKTAIYPNSYQDILTEASYGTTIFLDEDIMNPRGFERMVTKTSFLIKNYLNSVSDQMVALESKDLLDFSNFAKYGNGLEQLINASNGNTRRFILLLDKAMGIAYSEHNGDGKVKFKNIVDAIISHAQDIESQFSNSEKQFLYKIAEACKKDSTYKFRFPYETKVLNKFLPRSRDYNLLHIHENKTEEKITTHAFDYCFCIAHQIPTHSLLDSGEVDTKRSQEKGQWINKVARISEDFHQFINGNTSSEDEIMFQDLNVVSSENRICLRESLYIKTEYKGNELLITNMGKNNNSIGFLCDYLFPLNEISSVKIKKNGTKELIKFVIRRLTSVDNSIFKYYYGADILERKLTSTNSLSERENSC
jgi:hypothetical protein